MRSGLGVPVLPIRDTSYNRDKKMFDELGVLDNFGYFDFQNSHDLQAGLLPRQALAPLALQRPPLKHSSAAVRRKEPD